MNRTAFHKNRIITTPNVSRIHEEGCFLTIFFISLNSGQWNYFCVLSVSPSHPFPTTHQYLLEKLLKMGQERPLSHCVKSCKVSGVKESEENTVYFTFVTSVTAKKVLDMLCREAKTDPPHDQEPLEIQSFPWATPQLISPRMRL